MERDRLGPAGCPGAASGGRVPVLKRRLAALFGPWSAFAPAVALTGGLAVLWELESVAPFRAAFLPSVQIMAAVSAAAFLVLVLVSLFQRRWKGLLLGLGGLALLGYGAWWAAAHFDAALSLGVQEPSAPFEEIHRGPIGKPPGAAVGILEAPTDPAGRFQVGLDDRTVSLGLGQVTTHWGYRYRLAAAGHAPKFILETGEGASIDGALVKLRLGDSPDPFIQLGIHPHRFYVTREDGERDAGPLIAPDRLALRVVRGKLTVWKGTIEKGKAVPFESLALRYDNGAPWVRIEVQKERPSWLWLLAIAALLGASVAVR